MPTVYFVLRYLRGTLWYLCSYPDYFSALTDFNNQKVRYKGSKIQFKKHENGVVSTLFETKGE